MDTQPVKLTMRAPDGSDRMILERDREAFEKRGYLLVGAFPAPAKPTFEPVPPIPASVDSAASGADAPQLAVESRAFEQPARPAVRRTRKK